MMTARRIITNSKPMQTWGKIEPMHEEDNRFWNLLRQRKPHLYERKRA